MTLPKNIQRFELAPNATITAPCEELIERDGSSTSRYLVAYQNTYYDAPYMVIYDAEDMIARRGAHMLHVVAVPAPWSFTNANNLDRELVKALTNNPWRGEEFFLEHAIRWVEHMPRNSEENAGMLAYYDSPKHRARGRLTMTKPGRYLKRFFGDILEQPEIERLAHAWEGFHKPQPVIFTQDSAEAVRAYQGAHLGSCMAFTQGGFSGSEHPASVFCGTDLSVAVLGSLDEPTARCVVWQDKKLYMRPYGDHQRMETAMKAIGFTRGSDSDFDGARMARIEDCGNTFVLPYLDFTEAVRDDGDYLVADYSGPIHAQNTNGLGGNADVCGHCGDTYDSEWEGSYVESRDMAICQHCSDNEFFYCEINEEVYHNDEMVETDRGISVSEDAVRYSGEFYYCDETEVWCDHNHSHPIEMGDGRCVSSDWAYDNATYCVITHLHYDNDDPTLLRLADGDAVSMVDAFSTEDALIQWMHREGHRVCNTSTDDTAREHFNAILDDMGKQMEMELEAA